MNFKILPIILLMTAFNDVQGQLTPTTPTEVSKNPKETYTPKRNCSGWECKKYSPEQILRFTGLLKEKLLIYLDQKVSNAIKKLWDTNSFSKVEIYVQSNGR